MSDSAQVWSNQELKQQGSGQLKPRPGPGPDNEQPEERKRFQRKQTTDSRSAASESLSDASEDSGSKRRAGTQELVQNHSQNFDEIMFWLQIGPKIPLYRLWKLSWIVRDSGAALILETWIEFSSQTGMSKIGVWLHTTGSPERREECGSEFWFVFSIPPLVQSEVTAELTRPPERKNTTT